MTITPDDIRLALRSAADRRVVAERDRAAAMHDIAELLPAAIDNDLSVSEVSRLTGLTRVTIYRLLAQ